MLASFIKPSLVFTLTDIGYFSVILAILHFNVDGYSFKGNVTLKVKVNFTFKGKLESFKGNVTDGKLKFSVPVIFFFPFFKRKMKYS